MGLGQMCDLGVQRTCAATLPDHWWKDVNCLRSLTALPARTPSHFCRAPVFMHSFAEATGLGMPARQWARLGSMPF